jgi:hypothetical protein
VNPLFVLGIVLAALCVAFAIFVLLPKLFIAGMRGSLEARVAQRFPTEGSVLRSEYAASSFGVQSLGLAEWKGNGALVLTAQELRFFQFVPQKELRIFLEHIIALRLVRSHLGKSVGMQLLRVEFRGKRGPDAIAFWVPDPAAWQADLEAQRPPANGA